MLTSTSSISRCWAVSELSKRFKRYASPRRTLCSKVSPPAPLAVATTVEHQTVVQIDLWKTSRSRSRNSAFLYGLFDGHGLRAKASPLVDDVRLYDRMRAGKECTAMAARAFVAAAPRRLLLRSGLLWAVQSGLWAGLLKTRGTRFSCLGFRLIAILPVRWRCAWFSACAMAWRSADCSVSALPSPHGVRPGLYGHLDNCDLLCAKNDAGAARSLPSIC